MITNFNFWPNDLPRDAIVLYGQAVQTIAGADGDLTFEEEGLFYLEARWRGINDDVLAEWRDFAWSEANLEEIIQKLKPSLSDKMIKLLLFDSIRVAMEDSTYSLHEQDAVRNAAEMLDVDDKTVVELEILASMDKNVFDLKYLTFG